VDQTLAAVLKLTKDTHGTVETQEELDRLVIKNSRETHQRSELPAGTVDPDLTQEVEADPLDSATRAAKRNLNFVSASILALVFANHFQLPEALEVLGAKATAGAPMVWFGIGLLIFHACVYLSYRHSDHLRHERVIKALRDELDAIKVHVDAIPPDDNSALDTLKGRLVVWVEAANAEVASARTLLTGRKLRSFFDFWLAPILGIIALGALLIAGWKFLPWEVTAEAAPAIQSEGGQMKLECTKTETDPATGR